MMSSVARLIAACRRFVHDRTGVVAASFAIAMPVLIVTAGAGVDYGRAIQAKAALQSAADAAALGAVVTYGQTGSTSQASQIASAYETSATAMLPPSVTNVNWSSPNFNAPAAQGNSYSPYKVSVSATATVKTSFLGRIMSGINVQVSASAADPVTATSGIGACNTSAGDADFIYVYTVPRGLTGNYVPDVSKFSNSQLLYANKNFSQCYNGGYQPQAGTAILGFALKDVTGGAAAPHSGCNYDYIANNGYITGNTSYGQPMNNNQYGSQCQTSNWLFSTASPPSLATMQYASYVACSSLGDCSGGGNSGTSKLFYYDAGGYPTALGTDDALQIYIMNGTPTASSGTLTDPVNLTKNNIQYNNAGYASSAAPAGSCILRDGNNTNYCTTFASNTDQYKSVQQFGKLDCSKNGGRVFLFMWNDMGGYPDDLDYNDMSYYVSCGQTSVSTGNAVNYFAYLTQ